MDLGPNRGYDYNPVRSQYIPGGMVDPQTYPGPMGAMMNAPGHQPGPGGSSKRAILREERAARQLRQELMIRRTPTSKTIPALVNYCQVNAQNDPFLAGVHKDNNPWVTKKNMCSVL